MAELAPISPQRSAIVRAWIAAQADGHRIPSKDELSKRVPAEATHLLESTHRILRLYALSGVKNPKSLRRWKEAQTDPELSGAGFATSTAQQIAKELFPNEGAEDVEEPIAREAEPHIEVRAKPKEGVEAIGDEVDDGRRGDQHAVARVDASALNLFAQWQKQIKEERAEAATEARTQEREMARMAIESERKAAQANIEAERRDAQTKARLQRAHMRLYAILAIIVAMAGGAALGVAWARGTPAREPAMPTNTEGLVAPVPAVPAVQAPAHTETSVKPPSVETTKRVNESDAKPVPPTGAVPGTSEAAPAPAPEK